MPESVLGKCEGYGVSSLYYGKAGSSNTRSGKTGSGKAGSGKAGSGKVGCGKAGSGRTGSDSVFRSL